MAHGRQQIDLKMEQKTAIVYKLFAMLTSEESMDAASKYRFQRVTPHYTLVYGEEAPDCQCTEVEASDISTLSAKDLQWLTDANMTLIREFAEENKETSQKSLKQFFNELDKNLKEEMEKHGERKESATE
jgi:hypothetical protein